MDPMRKEIRLRLKPKSPRKKKLHPKLKPKLKLKQRKKLKKKQKMLPKNKVESQKRRKQKPLKWAELVEEVEWVSTKLMPVMKLKFLLHKRKQKRILPNLWRKIIVLMVFKIS